MSEPRTPWDDIQDLMASIGHEAHFEPALVPRPPLVCEPVEVDWEWPPAQRMPDSVWEQDEIQACRVHRDEYWPCETFRERGGVTPQEPHWVNQLVTRPVVAGHTYGFAPSPDLLFTEPESGDV